MLILSNVAQIISVFIGILWGGDCHYSSPVYTWGHGSTGSCSTLPEMENQNTLCYLEFWLWLFFPQGTGGYAFVADYSQENIWQLLGITNLLFFLKNLKTVSDGGPQKIPINQEQSWSWQELNPLHHCRNTALTDFLTHLPTQSWTTPDLLQRTLGPSKAHSVFL